MLNYSSPDVPVTRHRSKEAANTFNRNTNRNTNRNGKNNQFLIKTIRILRADIHRLSYVAKNIAVTNEVGERSRVGDTRDISERCVPG